MKVGGGLGAVVDEPRKRQAEAQRVRGVEAQIDGAQVDEAARHEPRSDQKDERQGYLADDERLARPHAMPAGGRPAAAILELAGEAPAAV